MLPWDARPRSASLALGDRRVARWRMGIFELAILVMIFLGFLGLILYVANHARSGDK